MPDGAQIILALSLQQFSMTNFPKNGRSTWNKLYGRKITWLETARFVFMGHIKMSTHSTALVQLQRKKWKGSMLL